MDENVEEKQNSVNTKNSDENIDNDNNKSNSNGNIYRLHLIGVLTCIIV